MNMSTSFISLFITTRKRSLGQGNIFTPVCHSVHRGGSPIKETLLAGSTPGRRHPPAGRPPGKEAPLAGRPPSPGKEALPREGGTPPSRETPGKEPPPHVREIPPSPDGYCCRRYASYWNAFLFPSTFDLSIPAI